MRSLVEMKRLHLENCKLLRDVRKMFQAKYLHIEHVHFRWRQRVHIFENLGWVKNRHANSIIYIVSIIVSRKINKCLLRKFM